MESNNIREINLEILEENLEEIKLKNGSRKLMGMLKCNAYGIGVKNILFLMEKYFDFIGVNNLKEALEIRKKLKRKKILIVAPISTKDILRCYENDISVAVCCYEDITSIIKVLKKHKINEITAKNNEKQYKNHKINVHLKINTGMNRLGMSERKEIEKVKKLCVSNSDLINIEGVFTHLNNLENKEYTLEQVEKILSLKNEFLGAIFHVGGSGCLFKDFSQKFDMIRVGIFLYKKENLFAIKSRILKKMIVKENECLGYGEFRVKKKTFVALLGIGYGDGIFKIYAKKGYVLINGERCKILNCPCMDMMFVEINENIYNSKKIQFATILGRDGKEEITLKEIAEKSKTDIYEILTSFNKIRAKTKFIKKDFHN